MEQFRQPMSGCEITEVINLMFSVNDTVMYGSTGVCKIADIVKRKFNGEDADYYVLKPSAEKNTTIYCPVSSGSSKLRRLLSEDEINDLIRLMPDGEAQWIDNDQLRKERFGEILRRGDRAELIKLIKTIYITREERKKTGKKLHTADEKAMKDAESIIYGEFAHVLNIEPDEVVPFITGKLGKKQKA